MEQLDELVLGRPSDYSDEPMVKIMAYATTLIGLPSALSAQAHLPFHWESHHYNRYSDGKARIVARHLPDLEDLQNSENEFE